MSEIEEEERDIVDHWSHEHPLILVETRRGQKCYGCQRRFSIGERGYGCSNECGYEEVFHEECATMAKKIRHSLHPQHILIQKWNPFTPFCSVCRWFMSHIGYICTSLQCEFTMHIKCAQGGGMIDTVADDDNDDDVQRHAIRHPSHPNHELKLLRRRCPFKCDACGTTHRDSSYTCTRNDCQYWIHEKCATLPQTMKREDHHHSLSLSFHVPPEYMKYDYKCDVCYKYLLPKYWIYHCELCRYAVHLKCAFNKPPHPTFNIATEKDMIRLPTNDVAEELIRPFVLRQRGGAIPPIISLHDGDDDKYKFLHHKHQLSLISSSNDDRNQEEDDDDEEYGKRSELLCDGCITPIFSSSSSSSSSSSKNYYYMSCGSGCKYNLHMACFNLPPELPSISLHHRAGHHLILRSSGKPWDYRLPCRVCLGYTNGLMYACKSCPFKADIKCASMPSTIYHAAHPQHPLNLLSRPVTYYPCSSRHCYCVGKYACETCEFFLCVSCALLPASITSRRWDKQHPLLLTHDANLNHPGDFYCDQCETEMNPKSWMYHCRHCDLSFHPKCFQTTSGRLRNIKFGQELMINGAAAHPHPLTYQLLTTKRRCDVCGGDRHEQRGFHCASCNFFICFDNCGKRLVERGQIEAVD